MYHMSKTFVLGVAHDSVRIAIIGDLEHQLSESIGLQGSFYGSRQSELTLFKR